MSRGCVFAGVCLALTASAYGQNLLANPDFEQVPNNQQGQGILPSNWLVVVASPDTYSNDGSYGLPPNGFNNFPGVTAYSGIRWVAGWSAIPETIGQTLSSPLVPGRAYVLRAHLRIAERADLRSPGTYDISLRGEGQPPIIVGRLGDFVTYGTGWVERELRFTAPAGAGVRPLIAFAPVSSGSSSYIGCDMVSLTEHTCRADFNADGVVNSQDFFDFLLAFFAQAPSADFNSDAAVNSQDFFDFLVAFFAGC
jgi:hypothetical protein